MQSWLNGIAAGMSLILQLNGPRTDNQYLGLLIRILGGGKRILSRPHLLCGSRCYSSPVMGGACQVRLLGKDKDGSWIEGRTLFQFSLILRGCHEGKLRLFD